jgi:hypothetical protein
MRYLAFLLLSLVATQAIAEVAVISFDQLVRGSDLIVVAKVESITKPLIGKRYAQAKITEVWKGAQTEKVEFLASRTWACDMSEANEGETVLLFLAKSNESRSYAIAHAGRGRMPLHTLKGKTYATVWPGVTLPRDTPTVDGLEPKLNSIPSVELAKLHALVQETINSDKTK